MKALKIMLSVLSVLMVAAFAVPAMATVVHITGDVNATYTLDSIDVSNDTVTIAVSAQGGSCTPSSASVSPTSITRNIAEGSTAASQTVSIRDNCNNNLPYTTSIISGGSFISVPGSGTGTMSVTLNTSGLAIGSYSGSISVTPGTYQAQTINVSVTVSSAGGGSTGGGTLIPFDSQLQETIPSLGENHYYYSLPSAAGSRVTTYMNTNDWVTNQDMFVSTADYPTCSGAQVSPVWSNRTSSNTETVTVYHSYPAGTTFYVTICNRSSTTGRYKLYYAVR